MALMLSFGGGSELLKEGDENNLWAVIEEGVEYVGSYSHHQVVWFNCTDTRAGSLSFSLTFPGWPHMSAAFQALPAPWILSSPILTILQRSV